MADTPALLVSSQQACQSLGGTLGREVQAPNSIGPGVVNKFECTQSTISLGVNQPNGRALGKSR